MGLNYYTKAQHESKLPKDEDFVTIPRELSRQIDIFNMYRQRGFKRDKIVKVLDITPGELSVIEALAPIKRGIDYKETGKVSDYDRNSVFILAQAGATLEQIANYTTMSFGLIKQIYREGYLDYQSITPRGATPKREDWAATEALFFLGISVEEISKKINQRVEKTKEMIDEIADAYTSPRKKGKTLYLDDKVILAHQHGRGYSLRQIAKQLGCTHQTVANQLKDYPEGYNPFEAHNEQKKRYHKKRGPYKLESCRDFINDFIIERRAKRHSPESWCQKNRLDAEAPYFNQECVCSNTIYNYTRNRYIELRPDELTRGFKEPYLEKIYIDPPEHTKAINGKSIDEMPEPSIIDGRIEPGIWEIDTLRGQKTDKQNILVMIEKRSHFCYLALLKDKKAETLNQAVQVLLSRAHAAGIDLIKCIIPDNGSEFSALNNIPELHGKVYFAHPATPTDKPQVERINEDLREFIKKGISMESLTEKEVRKWMDILNGKPVRSLCWASAEEVMCAQLAQQ